MPARTVLLIKDGLYHIYNRGSEKRVIFQLHRDYINFLNRVEENARKYAIDILCYCLMPNHFHFLVKQTTDVSTMHFMNTIQLGYAKFFNTKYERVGPLFQGRFKAKSIETEEYLLQLSAYIHKNPLALLSDSGNPKDSRNLIHEYLLRYPYSSYTEYLSDNPHSISKPETILSYFSKTNPALTYQTFVTGFAEDYEVLAPLILETEP